MSKLLDKIVALHGGIEKGAIVAFSKASKIPHPTVSRWCKDSPVDERYRPRLAQALGITVLELNKLLPGVSRRPKGLVEAQGVFTRVPVIGIISTADKFEYKINSVIEVLTVFTQPGENGLLSLKVSGSEVAGFNDGDYIILSPDGQYEVKSIIVVEMPGEMSSRKYTIRKVSSVGKAVVLKALSKSKDIKIQADSLKVAGVVRYMLRKM